MVVREFAQLKRAQAELLAAYKAERGGPRASDAAAETAPASSAEPAPAAPAWIGRVVDVVPLSILHGPHLIVRQLAFTGSPPAMREAAGAARLCLATPGRSVTDYAVDEVILLVPAGGAVVACKT